MTGPPHYISSRRAERGAQLRRRRMAAAALLGALVVALAVVLIAAGSGSVRHSGAGSSAPGPATASARGPRRAGSSHAAAPGESAVIHRLIGYRLPIYCAGPHGNEVAFTFDDGPGPYTHYAVKKLTESGERATFFAVGRSIDNFPGWLQRELKVAVIGDHTYTHPLLTQLPAATVQSEIARTANKIEAQAGQHVELFRPPYGARNTTVDQVVHELGLLEILWNVDSADSLGANWAGIIHNVEAGLHPGSIILMHENRGQTIRALTTLLPELRRRHLRSVSVPQLLSSDPPSLAQLRQGASGCGPSSLHGSGG